ncbi:LacI family transcriptional regulator [Reticulibacter mediterranei]|uniref:LacI family transcriptional regulator n=1 Tax=Reticulibacter mediterranei TaxID=2778369 RepID=A0A8J3ILS9_9CHLR|nr:LacI family DNA-binding transcriptional regulator [Reticulibacter mediterranei]GHO96866.1 LacI family transcriptional regulator [Reticulibacter mediterranei]
MEKKQAQSLASQRLRQRDIAQAANVSISTVSRVLSNVDGISQHVRERVLKAAASLGYQPTDEKLHSIHLFTDIKLADSPFYHNIMAGIEAECRRHDIALHYMVVERGPDSRAHVLEKIMQHTTDGLVFVAQDDRELLEQALTYNFRIVLVNAEHEGLPIDTVLPDNQVGPLLAMRHMIKHGHRSILHVTSLKRITLRRRYDAYRAALAEAGIVYDPRLVLALDEPFNMASAYERLKSLLAEPHSFSTHFPSFTAVFCANDLSAMGVARALQEADLRIPQDISLVGYDDLPMAEFMSPPLTTVRVDCQALGTFAIQRLIERAAHPDSIPIRVELFSRLIERQSVARRPD